MSAEFLGTYRAVVVRTNDPQTAGRVTLRIPQILGSAESAWASPSVPVQQLPNAGDLLYVTFESGDVAHPIYHANATPVDTSGVIPKQPTALTLAKSSYATPEGVTMARVTASWITPTENQDGSVPVSLGGYSASYSFDQNIWSGDTLSADLSVLFDNLPTGRTVYVRVAALPSNGTRMSTYSTANITTDAAPANPPAGSTLAQQSSNITSLQSGLTAANGRIDGKAVIWYQNTAPTGLVAADQGDIWINTSNANRVTQVWSGSAWQDVTDQKTLDTLSTVNQKITTFYAASTAVPSATAIGDLWFQTDQNNRLFRATAVGTGAWAEVTDPRIATNATNVASLQSGLTTANGRIDGKATIYVQTTDPNTPAGTLKAADQGDIWINTTTSNRVSKSWSGSAWLDITNQQNLDTLATVNTKVTTFYAASTAVPSATAVGDLWIVTDDSNRLKRASATGTANWVYIDDARIAANATNLTNYQNQISGPGGKLDGLSTTYYQTTDPNSPATFTSVNNGDMWVNQSTQEVKVFVWGSGPGTWQTTTNAGAISAATAASNAQSTANSKITTFYAASTAVPSALAVGDLWVVTDDSNRLKRASATGTANWVYIDDARVAKAATDIGNLQTGLTSANGRIDGKATIYVQTTDPNTPAGTLAVKDTGDIWINTSTTNRVTKSWSGSAWLDITDQKTLDTLATVNTKTTTYFTTTGAPVAPSGGFTAGDLWVDTSNPSGQIKRWSGTAWVVLDVASTAYISAKGTDLITNGSALLGNNYNFSLFNFSGTDAPTGASGSFVTKTTSSTTAYADELVAYDPSKRYRFSFQCRQTVAGASGNMYGFVGPVAADNKSIQPYHYMYIAGTTTTLAAALNPGDTTIKLTNAANWYGQTGKAATTSTYLRSIVWWDYVDGNGKAWPAETYSQNWSGSDYWADGGVDLPTNTITLKAPYAGTARAAGTSLSNGTSGGSFIYMPSATNTTVPQTWTTYADTYPGGIMPQPAANAGRSGSTWSSGMPPGTAKLKVGWLLNYTPSTGQHAVAAVSLSDASAASADAAAAITNAQTAQSTADGKAIVYVQSTDPNTPAGTVKASDVNDLWIDTGNGNVVKRWTGTAWETRQDTGIASALTNAAAAQTAADAQEAINKNPSFSAWAGANGTAPDNWTVYTTAPTKETALYRTPPNAVRFNCTDTTTTRGIYASGASNIPMGLGVQYVTVSVDVMLNSGTSFGGSGVLFDWVGMTNNRVTVSLATEIPSPVTGNWYRVTKVLARPSNATGTQTSWTTFLMGQYTVGMGAVSVKDVIFNRLAFRPSTNEEIAAYNSASAATVSSLQTQVNGKTTVYYAASTAPPVAPTGGFTVGDMWIKTDQTNRLYVWNGSWVDGADTRIQTALDNAATADNKAVQAQNSANGKNTIRYATTTPGVNDVNVAGDVWWQRDTNTGNIISQWEGQGGSAGAYTWISRKVDDQTIAGLNVGKLVAGTLGANVLLAGEFRTDDPGVRRTVINKTAIRQYDADGSVLLDFPNDPSATASITARIKAVSLVVADGLELKGQSNTFGSGAKVTLSTAVVGSKSPPVVTQDWFTYALSGLSGWTLVGHFDSTNTATNTARAVLTNPDGRWRLVSSAGANYYDTNDGFTPVGMSRVRIGSGIARTVLIGQSGGNYVLRSYDDSALNSGGTGAPVLKASFTLPTVSSLTGQTIGRSVGTGRGAEVVVATSNRSGVSLQTTFNRYTVADSGFTLGSGLSKTMESVYNSTGATVGVAFGDSGLMGFAGGATGTDYYVALYRDNTGALSAYTINTGGAVQTYSAFPVPSDAAGLTACANVDGAATADAAFDSFRTWSGAQKVYSHTNFDPTGSASLWTGFTWYDSLSAGTGTHESDISAVANNTLERRKRITVTPAPYPDPAGGAGTARGNDDVNAFRVYMLISASKPANSALIQQAAPADMATMWTLSGTPATSGSAPPTSSSFPTSSAAQIVSASTGTDGQPLLSITAMGAIHGDTIDANGATTLRGGATVSAGGTTMLTVDTTGVTVNTMPWKDYAVAWTQSDNTTLAISDGTLTGRYQQIGKTVHVRISWVRGANTNIGTAGQYWRFSLPVQANGNQQVGAASYYRGAGPFPCIAAMPASTLVYVMQAFSTSGARIGTSTPGAWAAGDYISINLTYEAA